MIFCCLQKLKMCLEKDERPPSESLAASRPFDVKLDMSEVLYEFRPVR